MNSYLIECIKNGRKNLGLTQAQVAEKLGIKGNTLSGYENGVAEPDIDTYIKLCNIYNLDYASILSTAYSLKSDEFTPKSDEISMLKKYRALDTYGKSMVDYTLKHEYERCTEVEEPVMPYITTPYYSIGASAGTGQYLFDDLTPSTITIPDTKINRRADLVVDVKGDSMLPKFENGDRVLVQAQDSIDVGQIGIFIVNGEGFIKKLGNGELISLNPTYKNIPLSKDDNVKCVGLVIGKL